MGLSTSSRGASPSVSWARGNTSLTKISYRHGRIRSKSGCRVFWALWGRRNPDRVADTGPQQHAEPDRGLDRAAAQTPRLHDPEMERLLAGFRELLVSGDRE